MKSYTSAILWVVQELMYKECSFSEAVIGLQGVQTVAVREGSGDARLNVGVLSGSRLSRPVVVRVLTVNIDAIGW